MRRDLKKGGNATRCDRNGLRPHLHFNHVYLSGSRTIHRKNVNPAMFVRPARINKYLWNYQLTKQKVGDRILGS